MTVEDITDDKSEPLETSPELEGKYSNESEFEFGPEDNDPPAKTPWKRYILSRFLAALLGAAAGGVGIYAGLKTMNPAPAVQASTNLEPLELKVKQLSTRLQAAEAKLKTTANRPASAPKPIDLSPLETRLKALETAPRPEIDPDALTSLKAAQKDGFEWPDVSTLEDRIAALEKGIETPSDTTIPSELMERLTALEESYETVQNAPATAGPSSELITRLEARLRKLEKRPAPKSVIERVSILAFPKDKLIAAVEENREGGLIEKTLSRHIRVKKANDPISLIDGIETDLDEGRLSPAIEKFERLPTAVQSAGQAWYESVKASL